jgi:quercetin dioxygenase-like cupin family protein
MQNVQEVYFVQEVISTFAAVSNVFIRQMKFAKAGSVVQGHTHNYDHLTLLAKGRLKITVNEKISEYAAPHMIFIHKDFEHRLEALEDDTLAYCIHAVREAETDDVLNEVGIPAGIDVETNTTVNNLAIQP